MGDAGEAVADLAGEGGEEVGLGAGERLGARERGLAFGDQPLVLGGESEMPAQMPVQNQAEREREGFSGQGQEARMMRLAAG